MSQGAPNPNYSTSSSTKSSTIFGGDYAACDEGSYFTVCCPTTVNTGSTDTLVKAGTNPNLVVFNSWPGTGALGGDMNIYLRYIKIGVVTIPTGVSSWNYGMWLDKTATKLTTAATLVTPINTNANSGQLSKSTWSFGANTTLAPNIAGTTGNRQVAAAQLCGAIPVVLDEWLFTFGGLDRTADMIGTTTLVSRRTVNCPPVIIGPQWFFCLGTWATSYTTASNYLWECGFVERPTGQ